MVSDALRLQVEVAFNSVTQAGLEVRPMDSRRIDPVEDKGDWRADSAGSIRGGRVGEGRLTTMGWNSAWTACSSMTPDDQAADAAAAAEHPSGEAVSLNQ